MNPIVIVPVLFRSLMLDRCIDSILHSDYRGDIVVTSCSPNVEYVCNISERVIFSHQPGDGVGNPQWELWTNCIVSLDKVYDNLILIHSDAIIPSIWYTPLLHAWSYAKDYVWAISLPVISHDKANIYPSYREYIYNHSYDEIIDEFSSKEIQCPTYVTNKNQILGLGTDMWHMNLTPIPTARISPCTSIPRRVYMNAVRKYGGDNLFAMELFMLYDMIQERKWPTFLNTIPLIHHGGFDTEHDPYIDHGHMACYRKFHSIFGYNLEHLLTIWSGVVTCEHKDEIVSTINEGRPRDIDYIFDEVGLLLDNMDCTLCRGRNVCTCNGKIDSIGWGQ